MQGSEHWVFIERNTSGLEELALKHISDIQKEETRTGLSEKEPPRDLSKVTTSVRELKTVTKQEEKPSEESKAQMSKRAKMIASPEDFESLWEDEMYERENRKHSSETDSQTTEEKDAKKDKTEGVVFASTESEEEKEPNNKMEAIAVASTKPGLTEEEKNKIETIVGASTEPEEGEEQKNKMERELISSTDLEQPNQSIKGPREKSTDSEDLQGCASLWSQTRTEENKIIVQEHRTILTMSDKEVLKTTSDFVSVKAKVKLSDKAAHSATERIIYIGSEDTDQQDNVAEKIPDRRKHCSSEKQESQSNLSDEKEETARFAPVADTEERGEDEFQSSSLTPTEGKSEITKPIIRSDQSDKNTEDDEFAQSDKYEQCPSKKEKASSIIEENAFVDPPACGSKDYRDSWPCSSTDDSSQRTSYVSSRLKSRSPTKEDESNLSFDQEQSAIATHRSLQESEEVSDEKSDIATLEDGTIFTTSETQREGNELDETGVSQILLQMEDIETTKPTLDSLSQQLSCTVNISKQEQHKTQDLKIEEVEQDKVLHSSKPPQAKLSETEESAQNEHISSEKSASDRHPELEKVAKNECCKLDFVSIGRLQELEDEVNANYIDVDQMSKDKPPSSEDSTEGKPSHFDKNSEVKSTPDSGSSEAEQSDRNVICKIDTYSQDEFQELGKPAKPERITKDKIPESEDKCCEMEELTKDNLKTSGATTLVSEEQAHDKSSNLRKPSGDYLLYHAGSPNSPPPEQRETLQESSLLKEEMGNVSAVSPRTGMAEDHKEGSQTSGVTAQSTEQLLISNGKPKPDFEPLKLIYCSSCTAASPENDKKVAMPPESDGDSLLDRSEANENISVASKIKMFEQGEEHRPLFHEQHEASKKSLDRDPSSDTRKNLPKMHIELQKDIPVEHSGTKIKSLLASLDSKAKDPGETSDGIYLSVAQGPSDGEPSQPSSWKEDISVGSEQGEGEEGGDAELASPDSGCEITLAEAVVTPPR